MDLPNETYPLEADAATLDAWLAQAGEVLGAHLAALPTADAHGPVGARGLAVAEQISTPITEQPATGGMRPVLDRVMRAAEASLGTAGPGYLAYVPGGGLPAAAVAGLVADCINRYTGLTAAAPALCRLEGDVLSWLAAEFGYDPVRARGLLTSGGSLATFSALVTARHAAFGDSGDYSRAVLYVSSQAHHSVAKAAMLAGIPSVGVSTVAVDGRLRLDPQDLRARIEADVAAGRTPFAVVSAAGTTNTGAIDPLHAVSEMAQAHGLWHHVDAAYGGGFILCPEGRSRLDGIARADSMTFDPHKGMFLPYGTGCLLVADGEQLRRAHHGGAAYLQDFDRLDRSGEAPSPTEYGPELSRPYRGLALWLPLVLHGAAAFRSASAEKLALAEHFHRELSQRVTDGAPIEIVDAPQLSTVAFRLQRGDGEALSRWNERNARWLAAINDRQRVYLSSTQLPVADGAAFTLRVCVLSFRTHQPHIDAALDDLAATSLVV